MNFRYGFPIIVCMYVNIVYMYINAYPWNVLMLNYFSGKIWIRCPPSIIDVNQADNSHLLFHGVCSLEEPLAPLTSVTYSLALRLIVFFPFPCFYSCSYFYRVFLPFFYIFCSLYFLSILPFLYIFCFLYFLSILFFFTSHVLPPFLYFFFPALIRFSFYLHITSTNIDSHWIFYFVNTQAVDLQFVYTITFCVCCSSSC